jgi:hypothetical protein
MAFDLTIVTDVTINDYKRLINRMRIEQTVSQKLVMQMINIRIDKLKYGDMAMQLTY